jgi:ABC-type nitrate/sulfonate/bicarbonate transport system permease component
VRYKGSGLRLSFEFRWKVVSGSELVDGDRGAGVAMRKQRLTSCEWTCDVVPAGAAIVARVSVQGLGGCMSLLAGKLRSAWPPSL